jgi:hypothetical protein
MDMTLFLATCIEKSFLTKPIFKAVYAFIPIRPSNAPGTIPGAAPDPDEVLRPS